MIGGPVHAGRAESNLVKHEVFLISFCRSLHLPPVKLLCGNYYMVTFLFTRSYGRNKRYK